jgi:peptidoglycan/xylan/chitin deacetylase (PgdA/CDA1 family)
VPIEVTERARRRRLGDLVGGTVLGTTALRLRPGPLRVLCYHGIDDPDAFARQLEWLVRHLRPVALDDVVESVRDQRPLPPRSVLVTFDDGNRSVLDRAAPLLHARRVPAVVFVVTDLIGTERPFWWDEVNDLAGADGPALVRTLKTVDNHERLAALDALRRTAATPRSAPQLTGSELRELDAAGVAVASHSRTHPCLPRCTDDEVIDEVRGSREALSELLGHPPVAFAYPNGDVDDRSRAAVREAGYSIAFTFDHRISPNPPPEAEAVSRVRVNADDTLARFQAIVGGAHPALHRALGRD